MPEAMMQTEMKDTTYKTPQESEPSGSTNAVDHDATPQQGMSFGEKFAIGLGNLPQILANGGLNNSSTPVYNIIFGLSPVTIGVITGLMRLWDAITDPIVGKMSDNWKGSMGRRRPFMFMGSILTTIAFPLLFTLSPEWGEMTKIAYITLAMMLFYVCSTIYQVSYNALCAEVTTDYKEKTVIRGYMTMSNKFIWFFIPWIFPAAQKLAEVLDNPTAGIQIIAVITGLVIGGVGLWVSLKVREPQQPPKSNRQEVSIITAFKAYMTCSVFWKFQLFGIFLGISHQLVKVIIMYIVMFYVCKGDTVQGASLTAIGINIGTIVAMTIVIVLSRYFSDVDKKSILLWLTGFSMIVVGCKWFIFTPENIYLSMLFEIMYAPVTAGYFMIYSAMIPDFCEYDEYKHGIKREGTFSALAGWVSKMVSTVAVTLSGILLVATGFDVELGGQQSESTFFMMRMIVVVIPAIFLAISFVLLKSYPLDKAMALDIRAKLDKRYAEQEKQA
jgi:GPH family glycoside/pentoside/hexuronide:cation symporter